jgi:predicted metallo-beta-lactamase superfamily hydrolase
MKILPIAFDSFGVRSMATLVIARNLKIFIDPGVALGPIRYGLPPTREEELSLALSKEIIQKEACRANIIVVTHYHYDHHPFPGDPLYECFKEKKVFAKNIYEDIHRSGEERGKIFEKSVKDSSELIWADGKSFEIENVYLEFSNAVWHGEVNSKVGKVIMVYLQEGKDSFVFGSDAQSLADPKALEWFIQKDPKLAIIDGYPTIFLGWRFKYEGFEKAKQNLIEAIAKTSTSQIILEHHIVRDISYKEKISDLLRIAEENGKKISTAAEFYSLQNFFLEAWRKEISEGKRKVDVEAYYKKLEEKIEKLKS